MDFKCCLIFKTLLECVRLRTFGKYGLQQIQVDTHYLAFYFTNRFCLLMDFKCCFILRLFWSVYDFGRLENMVYSRSKLTRTTCRCTYGDLYPMRSKGNLYIYMPVSFEFRNCPEYRSVKFIGLIRIPRGRLKNFSLSSARDNGQITNHNFL